MTMQQPGAPGVVTNPETSAHAPPAVVTPPAAPPAAPAAGASSEEGAHPWLPSRLQRERQAAERALLEQLGVPDIATAQQRVQAGATASASAARAAQLEQTVRERSEYEMASLTPAQQAAVRSLAGDDHARILTTINSLRPTWGVAAIPPQAPNSTTTNAAPPPNTAGNAAPPPAAPVAAPAAPPPAAPPADTAPGRTAPGGGPPPPATTHTAIYKSLLQTNPFAAAQYGQKFGALIAEGK